MAEAAALTGLGWVLAPVIKDLLTKSISYLGSDITKGLEDLETTLLPQFQLTMQAAQHCPPDHKAQLAKWQARLKNAYFDAEAILHELEYKRLKRKVKRADNKLLVRLSSKPIIKRLAKFIGPVVKKASLLSTQKRKLLKRLNKLKQVAAEANTLRNLMSIQNTESTQNANNSPFVTSSLLGNDDKVFGREGDRDEIIKFLLDEQGGSSSTKSYSVVAVTGMGGVGKTTLAQYVYNDSEVKEHFPVRMWLDFSQNLDITKRTKEMIGCAPPSNNEYHNQHNLNVLQNNLIETFPKSGNIIVVLDNVWYDNKDRELVKYNWEDLLKPFREFASQGGTCKIVVTSRSTSFPIALQPGKLIQLRDLAPNDFKSLLRYRTIDDLQISNPKLKNDLSDIVDQIAGKISKSPLAAKVVGDQLRKQPDISFWQSIRDNVDLSDIMEILLWSFHRFNVHLQRCFLFCSVFPKNTIFSNGGDDLVPYWVALDFIQPSDGNRSVEDIGFEYFEIMVANSIFHLVDKKYHMHDLFHDLAEKLSAEDCFRITNAERTIPPTVQHVFLQVNNEKLKENLSIICNLSNLRALILGNPIIDDISEIIPNISTNFRKLRVISIWSTGYKTLPSVVGDFRNLRMLGFWRSSIEELPDSVSQLYHLQFLRLPSSVKTLPTNLSNLIKLRRIEMFNSDDHVNTLPPVPYLGKLISLQRLDEFHVGKEKGYELHQLGPLKEIGGSLRIVNLENVRDTNEAVEARLIDKPKLKSLELVWVESAEINGLDKEVIEALRPPANLELLKIDGYRGSTYPPWLKEGSFIRLVKAISFYNCNALTNLPPYFHQFNYCSKLVLENLESLRDLSTFPENLGSLSIIKCPLLIFVCENELQVNDNQSIMRDFPEKRIFCCVSCCKDILDHELKSFKQTVLEENCAEQLQIIKRAAQGNAPECSVHLNVNKAWWSCNQQRMNFIFKCSTRANKLKLPSTLRILNLGYCCVSDGALSDCLRGMATLEELHILSIMTITTLPPAQVLESMQRLQVLHIVNCWYLRSLGGLHALPQLQRFLVVGCLCLEMGSGHTSLPPSLQSFIIVKCVVSHAIFNGNLSCLQNVEINNCSVPRNLSFRQLTDLKSLLLRKCPALFSIRGLEYCTTLKCIHFNECPRISRLPKLPNSIQHIVVSGCPVLRESCQLNGPDWHKVQRIKNREIE